ncbi:MAG: DUF2892 domain-containing protein [Rhodothermales bacterium]|nr:DUF2892 domain-containing protein [Rhodothermales bacterium]
MKKNVGNIDRSIRVSFGILILVLGFIYGSWWGLIGFVPLLTGFAGSCPAYSIFGLSTCKIAPAGK